ncbi:OmpA family protein [Sporocytophaga myxococcoides]|uniref:OmpA family protein n=1 Tax=Sporocytophaga myxococcoides TaxID=153721 RepID=UPI0003FD9931|nr:OmpA family protein [Sporocytophaga myxococcoides]
MHLKRQIKHILFSLLLLFMYSHGYGQTDENSSGVRITQSTLTKVKLVYLKNNLCNGDNKGAIDINVTGGIPPYSYKWSNGATTQDITGLKAGTYKLYVADSYKCKDSIIVEVSEPSKLSVETDSVAHILCFGFKKGLVEISVKGGVEPYKYSWSNGATTQDIHEVPAGTYSVLVSDANNCQEILSVNVEQKPLIVRSIDDVSNIKCSGDSTGKVDISVSGGVPPYRYLWNNGSTKEDLHNVPAGKYYVVVTDANNCQEASTTNVKEPEKLTLKIDELKHIKCNGDKGGAINVSVHGGVGPFKYKWSNGATTQDITGITAGSYTLNIIDFNGCKTTISATINQPPLLSAALGELKNVSFFGGKDGSINIKVDGGVPPYSYKWTNGATTKDVSGLQAGSYSVIVSDATGCGKTVIVNITQPQLLSLKLDNLKDVKCNGNKEGEIQIAVNGGVAPYKFRWNNGATTQNLSGVGAGNYSVEVIDANGITKSLSFVINQPEPFTSKVEAVENILCNGDYKGSVNISVGGGVKPYTYKWSNGTITEDLVNIPAGNYSAEIKDANGCLTSVSTTITESPAIALQVGEVKNILCHGNKSGAINVSVNGGIAPYTYSWSNGSTTKDLANIGSGDYSLKVTDSKGCFKTVKASIAQPTPLTVDKQSLKDVSCNGGNNGAVNIAVAGGVLPYTYKWSNGTTSKDLSNAVAGSYTVNVSDANGCTNSLSATITQPTKVVSTLEAVTNINCNGDSKGAVNISVSGGVLPYSYKWNNGATTQDLVGVKAGSYSVSIADAHGCKDTLSAKINQNSLMEVSVESSKDIKCFGESKGAVNITVKGGVTPYTYIWNNGAVTQNILDVPAGLYSVTVTDAVGCKKVTSSKISEPVLFQANLDGVTDVKCHGDSTGAIQVSAKGGVTPYSYRWSNGATSEDISKLKAGSYSLKVSDANGCTENISANISQPTTLITSIESITNVECNGENTGIVNISVKGGTSPYSYAWSNSAKTEDLTNVSAGNYSVKVSDANGCLKSLTANITAPPALIVTLEAAKHINCYGEKKGAISVSVKGGVGPYSYTWSNGATTEDIMDVPAGNYTVRVSDAKGCITTLNQEINQPAMLTASVDAVKNIPCYGDTTGSINISVKGGSLPYNFKWSNGATTEDLKGLSAGSYTVTITDAKGCIETLSAKVSSPAVLTQSLESVKHVQCNGEKSGIVNITVVGGTGPYVYKWSNGATTQDLTEVGAGSYSVTLSDANGCLGKTISATVNQPTSLVAKVESVKNIIRYGENTGAIAVSVSGGVAPYKFSWSNGTFAQNLAAAPAGNYTCLITDANGCLKSVSAVIEEPSSLVATIESVSNIRCAGEVSGAINIAVTGGNPPYSYTWSNGSSTEDLTNIPVGAYSVLIKDANGSTQTLKANITQPSTLKLKVAEVKNLSCFDNNSGSITTTITGGVPPYNFVWDNGARTQDLSGIAAGTYSISITDKNGCINSEKVTVKQPSVLTAKIVDVKNLSCFGDNKGALDLSVEGGVAPYSYSWSNGAKGQDITGLSKGNYSVKIIDANGCTETVAESISEPELLTASIASVKSNMCAGEKSGSINLSVSGGTAPYKFKWNSGDSLQNLQNLKSGKYNLAISDAKGCTAKAEATIEEPKLLSATLDNLKDIKCFGESSGEINVTVAGGVEPYSYNWSNGATTQDISGIEAGDYNLTVTDKNGCTNNSIKVNVKQPSLLSVKLDSVSNISCQGSRQGSINISVTGGTQPYVYNWSNGSIVKNISGLSAGNYTVKIKDHNGCMETLTADISEPAELVTAIESVRHMKCNGLSEGEVIVSVRGGVAPYKFKWSNGETSQNIQNVLSGDYSVTITDALGCSKTLKTTIEQPAMLVKSLDAIMNLKCNADTSGEIHVSVSGGVPPYSYQWNNGATSQDLIRVPAGDYSLTITEGNGCISTITAGVTEPPLFVTKIAKVTDILCYGEKKGSITLDVEGGVPPYKYQWSNATNGRDLFDLPAESYSALISDANGCLNSVSVDITQPNPLSLKIDSLWTVKCCGDSSGAIFISVNGGVGPYSYQWSNGKTTEDVIGLKMGQYSVTVTDVNGCSVSTPKEGMTLYDQIMSQGKFVTRNILFDVGKATIKMESFPEIMKIATVMKEHPELMFSIEGHTDSDGDPTKNKILSDDRSKAIKEALIKMGIDSQRLESRGFGQSKPIDTNTTKEGKSNNRRVEFVLITPSISAK